MKYPDECPVFRYRNVDGSWDNVIEIVDVAPQRIVVRYVFEDHEEVLNNTALCPWGNFGFGEHGGYIPLTAAAEAALEIARSAA